MKKLKSAVIVVMYDAVTVTSEQPLCTVCYDDKHCMP